MGDQADKLWVEAFGRPIWRWSLDALLAVPGMALVAVVVPADAVDRFRSALPSHATDRCRLIAGGDARADSVRAGLEALTDAGVGDATTVLVHDAARPAASAQLMTSVAEAATDGAGAIPVVAVHDTVKRIRDGMAGDTVDRTDLATAQTPQAASLGILRAALDAARSQGWEPTDEAAALAAIGVPVRTVPGDPANRKLTDPEDMDVMRAVLRGRIAPADDVAVGSRVGLGVDAHRLEAGRPLRLGGLNFPDAERGLAGHSDGDAALHALTDALLGAAGLGDIGTLFPSTDAAWADADSGDLLRRAVDNARGAGWRPEAADLVIGAESPAIAPRRDEMATRIAGLLGLAVEAVTVRGTTTDGLGIPGGEGIAAWAAVTVSRIP
jgi:2-C-methyl-D-erythritol 4-phosphate cytidylyltransferase/2-C-methyl-D-erythritol 2,4-cyclodiphosphate synthase